jgi:HlyD family secretion protein
MKRIIPLFLILVLLLALAVGYNLRQQRLALEAPPGSSGVVEGTRVVVASRIASRVNAVTVTEGARVQKGQTLIELDCTDLEAQTRSAEARVNALRAQLAAARAQASAVSLQARAARMQTESHRANAASLAIQEKKALRDSKRAQSLQEQNAMDTASVENLQSTVEDVGERLAAAKANSEAASVSAAASERNASAAREQANSVERQIQAAEADAARARSLQGECMVVAPTEGVVTVRAREPGEVVLPGATLLEIRDDTQFKVKFYVSNADLGKVRVGMKVEAAADAYPDLLFKGEVSKIAEEAEFTPRNVQTKSDRERLVYAVEARLTDSDRRLRAGMPVEVRVVGVKP